MEEQDITQVTTTKKIPTKLVATISIISIVLLTFIIGGLVILATNNNRNNDSNGDNNGTITPTPTSLAQCDYNGIKYESGQSFDKGDSCNTCSCEDGNIECSKLVCTSTFSETLGQYFLNDGSLDYEFTIKGEMNDSSEIVTEKSTIEIKSKDYHILIATLSEGNERYLEYVPVITSLVSSQRINYESSFQLNLPESKVNPILNSFSKIYFYGDSFKTEGCRESVGGVRIYGCGFDWIVIPFENQPTKSQALRVLCGVNDAVDVSNYCDAIIKSLQIQKL